jgi:uncharacterized protein YecE (DUF72 family)
VLGQIVIGTSSWADPGFVEHWYPKGVPARERLEFYAERFEAVEVNSTHYAIPAESTVERWVEATPDGFRFDVKLHRALSRHAAKPDSLPKDLRDDLELNPRGNVILGEELERELIERTKAALAPLEKAGKLTALLLQVTPGFEPDTHKLGELDPIIEGFAPYPVAVEFRRRVWMSEKRTASTLSYLSERDAVYVGVDAPPGVHVPIMPSIDAVTSDRLAYLRCHGRDTDRYMHGRTVAERFEYEYSKKELAEIADRAGALAEEADEVHVMFNNNARDLAPKAARALRQQIGQDPGPPP